jgi:hypothetical protein
MSKTFRHKKIACTIIVDDDFLGLSDDGSCPLDMSKFYRDRANRRRLQRLGYIKDDSRSTRLDGSEDLPPVATSTVTASGGITLHHNRVKPLPGIKTPAAVKADRPDPTPEDIRLEDTIAVGNAFKRYLDSQATKNQPVTAQTASKRDSISGLTAVGINRSRPLPNGSASAQSHADSAQKATPKRGRPLPGCA